MTINDAILPEYDHEMGTTRRLLERLPDGRFTWKPHDKSMSLGRLAQHIADIPGWAQQILDQDGLDMTDGEPAHEATSKADVLKTFDQNVAAARAKLASKGDGEYMGPWTLKHKGQTLFSMPKVAVVRGWIFSHSIHHRGQLSVYLRELNVPLPAIYGPSADEPM
jgi:uncharacterized damage-inducible protein DinB